MSQLLRPGRPREVPRRNLTGKVLPFVSPVAKRRGRRVAAAAKRNGCPSAEPKRFALLIHDLKISFDAEWAVIVDSDFRACQGILQVPGNVSLKVLQHIRLPVRIQAACKARLT